DQQAPAHTDDGAAQLRRRQRRAARRGDRRAVRARNQRERSCIRGRPRRGSARGGDPFREGTRVTTEDKLIIATRGSALALWQANHVKARLEAVAPGRTVELSIIKTSGDQIQDIPLAQVGGKGLFVKEIE